MNPQLPEKPQPSARHSAILATEVPETPHQEVHRSQRERKLVSVDIQPPEELEQCFIVGYN